MPNGNAVGELYVGIGTDIKELIQGLKDVSKQLKDFKAQNEDVTEETGKMQQGYNSVYGALTALGATKVLTTMWQQLTDCVKASIEFESALAGVAKTTDLSSAELEEMGAALKEMATEIPIAASDLAGITEAAGQLGISGADNLLTFTDTMAKLGTATNMTAEEGATMLAQFANITSMPTDEYSNLGSTIVALGNSSATTEKAITDMAQGMAAAGTNAGLSEKDILALSAAASSAGINAAAGSSSWSQFISKMQLAIETGDGLEGWARVVNMSGEEFKKAFKTDAAGVIDSFIRGLKEMDDNGESMIITLKQLGIEDIRTNRLIQSLANSGDLLTRSLQTANTAWEENTALNKEAATRFETTESKVQLLENSTNNLKIAVGDQLTPVYRGLIDVATDAVQNITEWISGSDVAVPILTGLVGVVGTYVAIMGALSAKQALLNVLEGAGIVTKTAATVATEGQTVAQYALNTAMLANPYVLLIAGLAGLAAAAVTLAGNLLHSSEEAQALASSMETAREEAKALREEMDAKQFDASAKNAKYYADQINDLASKTKRTAVEQSMLETYIAKLNEVYPELGLSIDNVNDLLGDNTEETLNTVGAQNELIKTQADYDALVEKNNELEMGRQESMRQLGEEMANLTEEQKAQAMALIEQNNSLPDYMRGCAAWQAQLLTLDESTREFIYSYYELGTAMFNNQEGIDANNAKMAEMETQINSLTDSVNTIPEATEDWSTRDQAVYQIAQSNIEGVQTKLGELAEDYGKAYNSALESLQGQAQQWEVLEASSDVTVQGILEGYESQEKYYREYTKNMETLLNRNIEGLDEWVKANNDGSKDTAAAYAQLAGATDEEIEKIVGSWKNSQDAQHNTAEAMAEVQTDYDKRFNAIVDSAKNMAKGLMQSENAKTSGRATMLGLINGINEYVPTLNSRMASIARTSLNEFKRAWGVASPAKEFIKIGKFGMQGLEVAAEEEAPHVIGAFSKVADNVLQAVELPQIPIDSSYITNTNYATNNTSSINAPINITLNAQQVTESEAQRLAGIVSREFAKATGGRI